MVAFSEYVVARSYAIGFDDTSHRSCGVLVPQPILPSPQSPALPQKNQRIKDDVSWPSLTQHIRSKKRRFQELAPGAA